MLSLLDDPVTRVQAAAAASMVHFFEVDDLPSFEGRLRPILERLVSTLQRGPLYIQEEVLATIGERHDSLELTGSRGRYPGGKGVLALLP